ncbi:MAG: phosphate ABC transporter substrate-binding protein PstS [Kiritimatiellae bacterium]|nr:phosphate ABC transporter substrate-binding protein PstS [Kiritimatiellia bacterium]
MLTRETKTRLAISGVSAVLLTAIVAMQISCSSDNRPKLNGAGGSFPAPLYQKWCYEYSKDSSRPAVSYQSVGSSAGISQIKAGTVDFAGTDAPLTEEECEKSGLEQFHMVSGAVVPAVNLPSLGSQAITLDGGVLADIYMGRIERWNDPRIAALNPGLALPDLKITVVHRGDGSGTTHIFTTYLTSVSEAWKSGIGAGTLVKWPCGIAGQKNPGVCNNVSRIKGAIGYTEYTFSLEAKLQIALISKDGKTVKPDEADWPILGKTYILTRKDAPDEKKAAMKAFFDWCIEHGGETAKSLHYIPLK